MHEWKVSQRAQWYADNTSCLFVTFGWVIARIEGSDTNEFVVKRPPKKDNEPPKFKLQGIFRISTNKSRPHVMLDVRSVIAGVLDLRMEKIFPHEHNHCQSTVHLVLSFDGRSLCKRTSSNSVMVCFRILEEGSNMQRMEHLYPLAILAGNENYDTLSEGSPLWGELKEVQDNGITVRCKQHPHEIKFAVDLCMVTDLKAASLAFGLHGHVSALDDVHLELAPVHA
jgi:hypothetical protein